MVAYELAEEALKEGGWLPKHQFFDWVWFTPAFPKNSFHRLDSVYRSEIIRAGK